MEAEHDSFHYTKSGRSGELESRIVIHSSPEDIWAVLTDFDTYPEWNPFIKKIQGVLREGSRLTISMEPPGSVGMNIKPVLLMVNPCNELRWLGHFLFPGLLDGEHVFQILDKGDGTCLFIQREYFSGFLLPLIEKMMMKSTGEGFIQMNEALRDRVEYSLH